MLRFVLPRLHSVSKSHSALTRVTIEACLSCVVLLPSLSLEVHVSPWMLLKLCYLKEQFCVFTDGGFRAEAQERHRSPPSDTCYPLRGLHQHTLHCTWPACQESWRKRRKPRRVAGVAGDWKTMEQERGLKEEFGRWWWKNTDWVLGNRCKAWGCSKITLLPPPLLYFLFHCLSFKSIISTQVFFGVFCGIHLIVSNPQCCQHKKQPPCWKYETRQQSLTGVYMCKLYVLLSDLQQRIGFAALPRTPQKHVYGAQR